MKKSIRFLPLFLVLFLLLAGCGNSISELGTAEQSTTEQSISEQSTTEQGTTEQSTTGQSTSEQSTAEVPAAKEAISAEPVSPGQHTLDYGQEIGLGSREYRLVDLDD